MNQAVTTFTIKKGEEMPVNEVERSKLTKGSFVIIYSGDMEGESVLEELKYYTNDMFATIYGLECFSGRIGDKSGSFVFERKGSFKDGIIKIKSVVIPGSGTGDLKQLRGEVDFVSGSKKELSHTFSMAFNYSLDGESENKQEELI